jgi:hypothetical protein
MIFDIRSIGSRVGWRRHDSANTSSVSVDTDSDIAILSPISTPGVLNNPVFLAGLGIHTVSNNENTVVLGDSASFIGDDTTHIVHEWILS